MTHRPGPLPLPSARALRVGARWAILTAILAVAAWRIDWDGVAGVIAAGSVWLLLAAAVANAASSVAKAMTWQGLVAALPSTRGRSRRGDMVSPLLVGALVNSVGVARAGDVVKVALARRGLARRGADVPLADLTGAMLAEHAVAMVAWGALIAGIAVVAPMPTAVWVGSGMVAVACGAFVAVTALRPPGVSGCRVGCGPAVWQRALRAIGGAWAAVHHSHRGLGRPPVAAYVGLAALGQWVFAWLAIAAVLQALGLGHVGPAGAGAVLACVTLSHALPITPGGVGINQLGAMLPLTTIYGVTPEQALAFAVALALTETGTGSILGAACAVREGVAGNRRPRARPTGTLRSLAPENDEGPLARALVPAGRREGAQ